MREPRNCYLSCVAVCLMLLVSTANALVKLEGYFIATHACEAFLSKNEKTNPGDILLTRSMAYDMIGINKQAGDFFQVRVPDAPVTESRWVSVSCGIHAVRSGISVSETTPNVPVSVPQSKESTDNLLALSWQPGFCELKPGKTECRDLNNGLLPVTETQLSIHGLWAQPRGNNYCDVPEHLKQIDLANNWSRLPRLPLSTEVREKLKTLMPGTASFLHRHEWIKHGTCHFGEGGAEEYYADTILVTKAINRSGIANFLVAKLGDTVSTRKIRAQFDLHFGKGAGERVQFHCAGDGNRVLLQELKISLRGKITPDADVGKLILAASPVSLGCPRGIIDPAGLQ